MKLPAILSLALAADLFAAEDKPKAETFLDPAKGGQDYVDQGEYKNDWGGAQIIALGDGNFRMVTCRGGLPGAGWDKEFKQETSGKRVALLVDLHCFGATTLPGIDQGLTIDDWCGGVVSHSLGGEGRLPNELPIDGAESHQAFFRLGYNHLGTVHSHQHR